MNIVNTSSTGRGQQFSIDPTVNSVSITINGTATVYLEGATDGGVLSTIAQYTASGTYSPPVGSLITRLRSNVISIGANSSVIISKNDIYGGDDVSLSQHLAQHNLLKLNIPVGMGGISYPIETYPAIPAGAISPHTVGFWTLGDQLAVCARDRSGRGNHFYSSNTQTPFSPAAGITGATGWLVNYGGAWARLSANPLDPRFDITAPGVSFLCTWQSQMATVSGDLWVLAKGPNNSGASPAGAIGLGFGLVANGGTGLPRLRVVVNNSSKYSSDIAGWVANQINHHAVVLDGAGAMGAAGNIYVFLNGVLDTGFNGTGSLSYLPTAANAQANLGLCSSGNNVTGADGSTSAASPITLRNLHLQLAQPTIPFLNMTNMTALIAEMAANPTHIPTD